MLTFKYGMELYGLRIGLAVALLFGTAVTNWIVLRTDWYHEVERAKERLAEGSVAVKGAQEYGV
jgi:MATE family multidrug resistance protein